jgi:hypothetical protein
MRNGLGVIGGSRRRTTGFSPLDLSPALWLDAADSATLFDATTGGSTPADAGTVKRWQDKSTNLRHVIESTAAPTRRTGVQNGRDVVRFAGSNKLAHSSSSVWNFLHNGTSVYHIFIAAKYGTVDEPNALYSLLDTCAFASANTGFSFGLEDRSEFSLDKSARVLVARGVPSNATCSSVVNNTLTPNAFALVTIKGDMANGTATARCAIRVNEAATTAGNALTNAASTSNSTFPLTIGSTGAGSFFLIGDIGEIIIVASDLTTTQRNDCEAYLRSKWGTPAPP